MWEKSVEIYFIPIHLLRLQDLSPLPLPSQLPFEGLHDLVLVCLPASHEHTDHGPHAIHLAADKNTLKTVVFYILCMC